MRSTKRKCIHSSLILQCNKLSRHLGRFSTLILCDKSFLISFSNSYFMQHILSYLIFNSYFMRLILSLQIFKFYFVLQTLSFRHFRLTFIKNFSRSVFLEVCLLPIQFSFKLFSKFLFSFWFIFLFICSSSLSFLLFRSTFVSTTNTCLFPNLFCKKETFSF